MQTAAALSAVKRAGLEARVGDLFAGISEAAKPGKQNGLRDLLGPGVTMLERDIGERRPEYARYVRETNAFLPGWPRA